MRTVFLHPAGVHQIVSTADKLLAVLPLFTLQRPDWSADEAAEILDVSTSTAYRYFSALSRAGLLESAGEGRYTLGPSIIAYDRQLRLLDPLLSIADNVLTRLVSRNNGEGVGLLCRRFRQQIMCVHQVFDHLPGAAVSYERGRPMGLYRGAASLIVLAHLPNRTLKDLWKTDYLEIQAAGLAQSWEELKSVLKAIRSRESHVTYGQLDPGLVGISAPLWSASGQILGSASIVVSKDAVNEGSLADLCALVEAAAREINVSLKNSAN